MKLLKNSVISVLVPLLFTACSEDEEPFGGGVFEPQSKTVYVINQGNIYGGVNGSIAAVDMETYDYTPDLFRSVNGQSIGDTPQGAVAYGSKIYVPVYGSDVLWVISRSSLKIVAQIQMNDPEFACATEGKVFVTNNDGYVSRIDTLSLEVDKKVSVGPNPAQITAYGGKVYASVSDGYNYDGGYLNGKRVAVLDAVTGEYVMEIAVGLNPGPIATDGAGNVYVVSRGNYSTVKSVVQRIDARTGAVTNLTEGTLIAVRENNLYVLGVDTDWTVQKTIVTSKVYDTTTGELLKENYLPSDHVPGSPNSIDIEPATGRLFICVDKTAIDYDRAGSLFIYESDGSFVQKIETGIHPCGVVFR